MIENNELGCNVSTCIHYYRVTICSSLYASCILEASMVLLGCMAVVLIQFLCAECGHEP